jgi:antitoxin (DNA-binding transcriptional repressor) of toxin-antitoxin stability system
MTVSDLRLHWPNAEKALAQGKEIVVTRDAKPVARLLPILPATSRSRPRFDPKVHLQRLRRFWRRQPAQPSTAQWLAQDHVDRAR